MIDKLPVYILAGGRSLRFGSDKADALINGQSLVERLIHRLSSRSTDLTIVTRQGNQYPRIANRLIEDEFNFLGPVAGILRALKDRHESHTDSQTGWVLIVPCDLLEWHDDWLNRLADAAKEKSTGHSFELPRAVCFADKTKRWEPFPGLYHVELIGLLEDLLTAHRLSMQGLLNDPACRSQPVSLEGLAAIRCANTPQELKAFLHERDRS
jgi:molybdopterin-guanine dinucleotide biosynthesis protein A